MGIRHTKKVFFFLLGIGLLFVWELNQVEVRRKLAADGVAELEAPVKSASVGKPIEHPQTHNQITFGLEAEFVEQKEVLIDPETMKVNLSDFPFLYPMAHRELLLMRNPTPAQIARNLRGNFEVNTLPVNTLANAIAQGKAIKEALRIPRPATNRQSGIRGYHMHIRIPKEFLNSLPASERDKAIQGFASALSEQVLFHRLVGRNGEGKNDPFLALGSPVQQRVRPQETEEKKGNIRLIVNEDHYDFEIRGAGANLDYLEKIASRVISGVSDPKKMLGAAANWNLMEAMHIPKYDSLEEYLAGETLTNEQMRVLKIIEKAGAMRALPLYAYDEFPLFSNEQREKISAQNRLFKQGLLSLLRSNEKRTNELLKAQFQKLQQRWAVDAGLHDAMVEALDPQAYLDPQKLADFHRDRVLHGLSSPDPSRRIIATQAIAGMRGPHALSLIDQALLDREQVVRMVAMKSLAGRNDAVSLERIKSELNADKPGVASRITLLSMAILALGGRNDVGAMQLLSKLGKEKNNLIFYSSIARALNENRGNSKMDAEVSDVLATMYDYLVFLRDEEKILTPQFDELPKLIFTALEARGDAASLELIRKVLLKADSPDQILAARALSGRNDAASLRLIELLLKDAGSITPMPEPLLEIISSLGGRKSPEAILLLKAFSAHPNAVVRAMVAEALSKGDYATSGAILRSLVLDSNPEVRAEAVWAAGRLDGSEAAEILEAGLKDRNFDVREQAFQSLGNRTDDASIRLLERVILEHSIRQADPFIIRAGRVLTDILKITRGPKFGPTHIEPDQKSELIQRVREHHSITSNDCYRGLRLLMSE